MKHLLLTLVTLVVTIKLFSQVMYVPQDYPTIQQGIDNATNGDTVIVDQGTYFENINFKGKAIVVTSKYILDEDPDYILSTIIDGSAYSNIDSASCVVFVNDEDSNSVIQGFTLTGGKGTYYDLSNLNEPTYMGMSTHEGGGVFIDNAAPTIKHNLIIDNEASNVSGYEYHGGGAISSFLGNPKILNNIIMHNEALGAGGYAPGIVFNKSNGLIQNNVICQNYGYAGGAIFIDIGVGATIINNTIVENTSQTPYEAGLTIRGTNSVIVNNIIWGNIQGGNQQIQGIENSLFEYNDSEQVFPGYPNIYNFEPQFSETNYYLESTSPCIDLGDPDPGYNDREDPLNTGFALFPSHGKLRNDLGAYGGGYASVNPNFFPTYIEKKNREPERITIFPNPARDLFYIEFEGFSGSITEVFLINVKGQLTKVANPLINTCSEIAMNCSSLPAGAYLLVVKSHSDMASKRVIIK